MIYRHVCLDFHSPVTWFPSADLRGAIHRSHRRVRMDGNSLTVLRSHHFHDCEPFGHVHLLEGINGGADTEAKS